MFYDVSLLYNKVITMKYYYYFHITVYEALVQLNKMVPNGI